MFGWLFGSNNHVEEDHDDYDYYDCEVEEEVITTTVSTGSGSGGAVINGSITVGGDFYGRDKITTVTTSRRSK